MTRTRSLMTRTILELPPHSPNFWEDLTPNGFSVHRAHIHGGFSVEPYLETGALPRSYRQLSIPNSSRSRVLKFCRKIVVTFNLELPPTPSETKVSNISPFPRIWEMETIDQSKELTLSDMQA
ncbi:hypothetical protein AVEN_110666-1 [Araneus ventricosus]|uniref:Uncharacterized protein n=1 Tax=Araneus ventricosus TaxID=182803 RepID=A0A4Y2AUF9_ARAVE|nr:hypothetical protein AVEN_110666-1 [Araneus ventricosus]